MALRGYKWVVKWYFLVGLGIRTGLRIGLDMSKMVFFSSTDIKMGLRLGLDMVLGVILEVLYVRRGVILVMFFLYSLPIGQVIKIGKKIWTYF